MDDFLQYIGRIGTFLLKVLVALVILRMLSFAIGLPIVDYIPIIDDVMALIFAILKAAAEGMNKLVGSVIRF